MKVITLCYGRPRLTAFTLLLLWCERFKLVWSFPIILAGTCTQHNYGHKGLELFSYLNLKGSYPILEPSAELNPARISFWRGPNKCLHLLPTVFLRNSTSRVAPPLPFVLATYPKVSSLRAPRRRQRNQPACCGGAAFLFHNKTWTIIPTLGSLRVYVHPWPDTVSFRFLPCSRYPNSRKCVHTPKLTWRGIHSREQTQPLHTPRSTPSCISIQDPSRRVEVLRGTHYSEYPPKRKKMCLSGSVLLSWVGRVRPEMLCLHTRLPLFPKASRGRLYDDGRPPVGGLLHKAPAEEKLYPSE